jgi:hypothetical protein
VVDGRMQQSAYPHPCCKMLLRKDLRRARHVEISMFWVKKGLETGRF